MYKLADKVCHVCKLPSIYWKRVSYGAPIHVHYVNAGSGNMPNQMGTDMKHYVYVYDDLINLVLQLEFECFKEAMEALASAEELFDDSHVVWYKRMKG